MDRNNLKFEIGNWKLTRQGFTIVELLVAMSLLVILLGLSGMVFKTTVAAHRAGGASIDVSRNLRAITDQLNADFRGLQKDAPVFITFNAFDTNSDGELDSYYDTIHFFADGDFQTTHPYYYDGDDDGNPDDYNGDGDINRDDRYKTIYGNISRVFYGHSNTLGNLDYADNNLLVRKSHILTSESRVYNLYGEIPAITNTGLGIVDYTPFDISFGLTAHAPLHTYIDENELEFNTITLTNWINALNLVELAGPLNANHFITNCMTDTSRPMVDLADIDTLHLLLSQGVVQMRIQWAYTNDDLIDSGTGLVPVPGFAGVRWWPSIDPAGGSTVASDFGAVGMNSLAFGTHFKLSGSTTPGWYSIQNCRTDNVNFRQDFYPRALKFTLVLRDSNGVFADGKTFTHIVYIDN